MLIAACKYGTQLKHINEQKQTLMMWSMDQFLLTIKTNKFNKKLSFAFAVCSVLLLINWPLSMLFWQTGMCFGGCRHNEEASFLQDKFRVKLWTVRLGQDK